MDSEKLWNGLRPETRTLLRSRDYSAAEVEKRLGADGLEAHTALEMARVLGEAGVWIPGVELMARHTHPQRHRGIFS